MLLDVSASRYLSFSADPTGRTADNTQEQKSNLKLMQMTIRFAGLKTSCIVALTALVSAVGVQAQEVTISLLPNPPLPQQTELHAVMKIPGPIPRKPRSRWINLNSLSITTLLGGEALDSWSTYRNLTHRGWICGYSPAFGNAPTYISNGGRHYDAETIQNVLCGPGPSGQIANYAYDATRTGAFTEQGWVTQYHLARNRNFPAIEAWNLADDLGQLLGAHYLHHRKGLIRRLGPALNFSRGAVHLECGILNIRFARIHNNSTTWQFNVPDESRLYPGPRWWGKR